MKKIIICIFYCLAIMSLASSCKHPPVDFDYFLTLKNNSNTAILYLVGNTYPDTLIPNQYSNLGVVGPNLYTHYTSSEDWTIVFSNTKAGKMSFFFFNPDTISKYGWQNVVSYYKILKRKDVTYQDVENNQWTVTYP
jgi:hypothetical protein